MNQQAKSAPLDYVRRLYANVVEWSDRADAKARLLVTIDGAFIAFLTGSMFAKQADLALITGSFTKWTWVLLLLMVGTLAASIITAMVCVTPSLRPPKDVQNDLEQNLEAFKKDHTKAYTPQVLWYCRTIRRLDRERFVDRVGSMSVTEETTALADQTWILAGIAYRKHRWVSVGYWLAGATLVLFLAAGVMHVWHTHSTDSTQRPSVRVRIADEMEAVAMPN